MSASSGPKGQKKKYGCKDGCKFNPDPTSPSRDVLCMRECKDKNDVKSIIVERMRVACAKFALAA